MHFSQLTPRHQVTTLTTLIMNKFNVFSCPSAHPETLKNFIAETNFYLRITQQQLAHLTKGASTFSRVLYYTPTTERTCDSSGDSSCRHLWCTSHDLRPVTRSTLWRACFMNNFNTSSWTIKSFPSEIIFSTEIEFWVWITLSYIGAPQQRCQHHDQGALVR